MTRILMVLLFATLFGYSISAQESNTEVRTTLESLSPEASKLAQMSNDCAHFKGRLSILKEAYAARETAKVIAYHQLLLDAMREEVNQAMEGGEAQKTVLESLTQIMTNLEGQSFDVNKPQEAQTAFAHLDKFLVVMQDALMAETEKSSNKIQMPASKQ